MKIKIIFILSIGFLLLSVTSCRMMLNAKLKKDGQNGYYDKDWEWVSTKRSIYTTPGLHDSRLLDSIGKLNRIDFSFLEQIQADLDAEIDPVHCFSFFYDSSATKFLGFFVCEKDDVWYTSTIRGPNGKGGAFLVYDKYDVPDGYSKYIGYNIAGLLEGDTWYFNNEEYVEFYAKDLKEAQNLYSLFKLYNYKYLNFDRSINWMNGQFAPFSFNWDEKYFNGQPIVKGWALNREYIRTKTVVQDISRDLILDNFDQLQKMDPKRFKAFDSSYTNTTHNGFIEGIKTETSSNFVIYTFNADTILFPLIYSDIENNYFITILVGRLLNGKYELFLWEKESPVKLPVVNDYLKGLGIDENQTTNAVTSLFILRRYQPDGSVEDIAFNNSFWNENVFVSENGVYTYLKKIN